MFFLISCTLRALGKPNVDENSKKIMLNINNYQKTIVANSVYLGCSL